ncbi:MAG: hypothetical protein N4A38_05030 [Candidatus Gracilibacteria bacterium]|nr:hypothetical protein [Candidatus Gracilibacteria bacterium]
MRGHDEDGGIINSIEISGEINEYLKNFFSDIGLSENESGKYIENIISKIESSEDPEKSWEKYRALLEAMFQYNLYAPEDKDEYISKSILPEILAQYPDLIGESTELTVASVLSEVNNIIFEESQPSESEIKFKKDLISFIGKRKSISKDEFIKYLNDTNFGEDGNENLAKKLSEFLSSDAFKAPIINKGMITSLLKGFKESSKELDKAKKLRGDLNGIDIKGWEEIVLAEFLKGKLKDSKILERLGGDDIVKRAIISQVLNPEKDFDYQNISRFFAKDSLIKDISNTDKLSILDSISEVVFEGGKFSDLTLRVGLGGSENEFPVRILSYMSYVLSVCERLQSQFGDSPKVELFTGEEGAINCNGMDADKVRKNTQNMFKFISNFVGEHYPDVKFNTLKDPEWEKDSKISYVLEYLYQEIVDEIESGNNKELSKIVDQLKTRAENRGGGSLESALRYSSFHTVCFQDIQAITNYVFGEEVSYKHIISVGGMAEREFGIIRDVLSERFSSEKFNEFISKNYKNAPEIKEVGENGNRANVTTNTGAVPPYYKANELDPTIGDDIASSIARILAEGGDNVASIFDSLKAMFATFSPQVVMDYILSVNTPVNNET